MEIKTDNFRKILQYYLSVIKIVSYVLEFIHAYAWR